MFRIFSYPLTADAPVWPGNPPAAVCEPFESQARGDMANTTVLHLFSHSGTHMDTPWHFNSRGLRAAELPIDRYVFTAPFVLDIPKPPGGSLTVEEFHASHDELEQADLLLIRTGQSRLRDANPEVYANASPVILAESAAYLMDNFPKLKAIAVDAISIGSKATLDDTIRSHEILTGVGRTDGRFVLIYEDVRIDPDLGEALRIYAWPLFIMESDGSPCTMVAEFADRA